MNNKLTTVQTARYRPIGALTGGANYWGLGGFYGNSLNGFHLGYVERMKSDYQVSLCHNFLVAPLACAQIACHDEPEALKAQIVIKAEDPNCGQFIKKTMQRFWNFDLDHVMEDIGAGYSSGEGVYKIEDGFLHWDHIKPMSSLDVEPYTDEGRLHAVRLKPSGSSGMQGEVVDLEAATVDSPGKGLWFVNNPKMSLIYGRSDYYAAWHDWRVKSGMPDCVREIVFKATYKHSFSGQVFRYPEGNYVDADGNPVNNRDDAEQMCELSKAGTNFALSSQVDSSGKYLWAIESYGKNEVDISRLIPIVEMHDKGIRRGMGIPDEIIDHDGNTGGYSRSRVSISAFFMQRQRALARKVEEFKRQIGDQLARANFHNSKYEIEVKPLLQDPDQAQGGGMLGGQPGAPAAMGQFGQPEQYDGIGGVGGTRMSLAANRSLEKFGKLFNRILKAGYEAKKATSLGTRLSAKEPDAELIASGCCVYAEDTGRVLMLQRAMSDDDPAAGTWEFPGGHIEDGEQPWNAAKREWSEETGLFLPRSGKKTGDWLASNGVYQGFVYTIPKESSLKINSDNKKVLNPDDPDGDNVEVLAWFDLEHLTDNPAIRSELQKDIDTVLGLLLKAKKTNRLSVGEDGLYHGPEAPAEGWVLVGQGPKGGKIWQRGEDGKQQPEQTEESEIPLFENLPEKVQNEISTTWWDSMNQGLRSGENMEFLKPRIENADKLIQQNAVKITKPVVAHRGVSGVIYPTEIGSQFTEPGYLRLTSDHKEAGTFSASRNRSGQVLNLKMPPGTSILPGDHVRESELYLPRNATFKIVSVKKQPNGQDAFGKHHFIDVIEAELVPSGTKIEK